MGGDYNSGFGDLTIKVRLANGHFQEVKISDTGADANNNGKIDASEFNNLVEYINEHYGQVADTFNFNSLATLQGDNQNITAEEFAMWEQEELIDRIIEDKLHDLSADDLFTGPNCGNIYIMRAALQQFKAEFMSRYTGAVTTDIANMASQFATEIVTKINEIKGGIEQDVEIKNTVNNVIAQYYEWDDLDESDRIRIYTALKTLSEEWVKNNDIGGLEVYLCNYLENDAVSNYNGSTALQGWKDTLTAAQSSTGMLGEDSNEVLMLKGAAADLIEAAYSYGIGFVKNGHEVTKAQLLAQINGYSNDPTGANKLVTLITHINDVLEEIGSCTVAELLLQGKDKVKIDITNGDVVQTQTLDADSAKAIIRKAIDDILSDYEDYPSNILQQAGELLRTKANAFYSSNTNLRPDEFETKLRAHLDEYMKNPIGNIHDELQEYYDAGMQDFNGAFNLEITVDDEELDFLKDMFRKIISTAANHHVIILDSNGQKITTGNVNDFLSGFGKNPDDATSLYHIIDEIMRRLDSLEGNLIDLLASNAGNGIDVTINIDGTIVTPTVGQTNLEGAEALIEPAIGYAMKEGKVNTTNYDIIQKIHARLETLAYAFLNTYTGSDIREFDQDLCTYLLNLVKNPLFEIQDNLTNIGNEVDNIDLSNGCSEEELAALKEQFNALIAALGSNVQLLDENGNPLTINLDNYTTNEAVDLKKLITSIINLINGIKINMQQLFETYEDGVIKLYVQGSTVTTTKPETLEIPDTGFGVYQYEKLKAAIIAEAKKWIPSGMTYDESKFNEAIMAALEINSRGILNFGLICCDPQVFANRVKTTFLELYKPEGSSNNPDITEMTIEDTDAAYQKILKKYGNGSGDHSIWWFKTYLKHTSTFYGKLEEKAKRACEANGIEWGTTVTEHINGQTTTTFKPGIGYAKFVDIYDKQRDKFVENLTNPFNPYEIAKKIANAVCAEFNAWMAEQ